MRWRAASAAIRPAPSDKKWAGDHEHCVRRFLVEASKLRVDFLGCARFQDKQFLPERRCGVARIS
jgi:hypothetical protein